MRTLGRAAAAGALAALLAGTAAADWQPVEAGRGPVAVQLPPGPAPAGGYPLVVLLHGFGASGAIEELYLGLAPRMAASGFLYALPDGTENPNGNRFWNATDACCDHFGSGVDDVGYLLGLVDAIDAALGVDPRRVAFVGHSNGGFMAYRMGCSAAAETAGLVALAGATYLAPADCAPARPVRVLHIHGTADERIDYQGGVLQMDPIPAPRRASPPGPAATAASRRRPPARPSTPTTRCRGRRPRSEPTRSAAAPPTSSSGRSSAVPTCPRSTPPSASASSPGSGAPPRRCSRTASRAATRAPGRRSRARPDDRPAGRPARREPD